ncbi:hydroxymethylglutaryl-CoA lyase [Bhargavaea cecembensis]|uniref:Hydroxymethylglutaryl-CoA lyase n=1 Tax=Bhargavaea cecembensis TaxID=394098 RepID=A0A165H4Y1_9BACL|nr:hydroxymethylglutaryl-CoA lyase [Bhargavaea cecembensis]KZE38784.1 hydroxymethylglutaryl-CoA lyase [Bhargavaea cecembensis]
MPDLDVVLTDVTGRDGFQMEKEWIPTDRKAEVLNGILASGVKRLEATSFVSPKAVPQLKDAKEVLARIDRQDAEIIALVPNLRGAEFAREAGADKINFVLSISETHNRKNVRRSVDESLEQLRDITEVFPPDQIILSLGTTFGCPFEGLYAVDKVHAVIGNVADMGLSQITLCDTTGMANPKQVTEFVRRLSADLPEQRFALHLHNTRGMGLANAIAGYQEGIRHFDAALGGIGGCPFAPGASGNVTLDDVAHMFELMGVKTGIDMESLIGTARRMQEILGYELPGQVMKAGTAKTLHPV